MTFDLLTSTQGHQFDPRMKILLAFCSACHPVDLIWHMTMFGKNDPLGIPSAQKSDLLGMTQALYLSFVRTNAKFGIKIIEIDFVIEIK